MSTITTREEIVRLAALSRIELKEEEIETITKQIFDTLQYAARVSEAVALAAAQGPTPPAAAPRISFTRPDSAISYDADRLLAQAPQRMERYIVVPAILETP